MTKRIKTSKVDTPRGPRFVLWSTEESVRRRIPSALATLEVLIAVAAYWTYALYRETSTHLWLSICIAPLLLLRSDQSIALGVKWFAAYVKMLRKKPGPFTTIHFVVFWIAIVLTLFGSTFVSYVLTCYWLVDNDGWSLFWYSAVVGFVTLGIGYILGAMIAGTGTAFVGWAGMAVAVGPLIAAISVVLPAPREFAVAGTGVGVIAAIFGAIAAAKFESPNLLGFKGSPGGGLGIWLRSVEFRFAATFRYFWIGLRQLPENFVNSLFVMDFRHPAELMPGYRDIKLLTSDGLFEHIRSGRTRLIDFTVFGVFFIPAYLYRLSIKSTCWLFWPLAYVVNDAKGETRPAVLFEKRCNTPLARLSFFVAAASISWFIITNLNFAASWPAVQVAFQIAALDFLFQVDWAALKPWVYFNLIGAAITVCLFFWAGQMRAELNSGDLDDETRGKIYHNALWMKRLARLGRVCTALLVLSLLCYFLLWRSPLQCRLNDFGLHYILVLFRQYYGAYLPQGPACV